jgi:hypothetical protein
MTHTKPLAIRNGKLITHYIYRDVVITRENEKMFTWTFCRFDMQNLVRYDNTLKTAVSSIDKTLDDENGRTTGGRLVLVSVENGQIVSALSNSDWRYPNARLAI